jgi:hypothetical protein
MTDNLSIKDPELADLTNDICKNIDGIAEALRHIKVIEAEKDYWKRYVENPPPLESEYCWCSMRLDHNGRCPYHTIDDE